jgi:hypothetical protein
MNLIALLGGDVIVGNARDEGYPVVAMEKVFDSLVTQQGTTECDVMTGDCETRADTDRKRGDNLSALWRASFDVVERKGLCSRKKLLGRSGHGKCKRDAYNP